MTQAIKTAIASFGMSGQVFHGPSLKVNSNFKVTAILERSKELSKKLFPDALIVRSYEDLLKSDVELIIINTPDILHFEMGRMALEAGKHIVVEKPFTLLKKQALRLIELAKEKERLIMVYQNRRWDGDFLTVQKVMNEAKYGRLIEFESHFDRYRTFIAPNTWKEEGDEYAGVLYNLGSHMVDQVYVLFGMPKAITAHLKIVRDAGVVTDYYDIRLEYEKHSALIKCSYLVKDPGPRYTIHGEYGTFKKWGIDPQEELLKAGNLPQGDDWGTEPPEEWGTYVYEEDGEEYEELVETVPGNYNAFYENVFKALRENEPFPVKPEEVANVLGILEACIESSKEKRTIFLGD